MAKILLVEDDLPLLRLYEDALKSEHIVIPVETSAAAIAAIDGQRPDLVVLDLNLPDAPGTTILNYIEARADMPNLRVVVMTGFSRYRSETLPGVVQVLSKPVTASMLLRVVNAAITSSVRS